MDAKKYKVLSVLNKLENECSVNYEITESGSTFLNLVVKTDVLTKYHLSILSELDNLVEYHIYPVNGYRFMITIFLD